MNILDVDEYKKQVIEYANCDVNWDLLKNSNILITGATGMIGKSLIDIIMYKNNFENLNCKIIALGRQKEKAIARLGNYFSNENFSFIESDIDNKINIDVPNIEYIIHAASSTNPLQYSKEPIKTITANVIGTYNLLNLAKEKNTKRFLFLSSVEIYGENKGDIDKFDEKYLGYIDCNTLRAGYPESKRTGEALCQAFIKEKDLDVVIARLSRVFGPTVLNTDNKASSQFIKNGVNDEDIVLKSKGLQNYSYTYVFDAITGLLTCLTKGTCGEAYNISDDKFDITLAEFANICANCSDKKVTFDLPDEVELSGYSTATKALMDSSKIKELGWDVHSDMKTRVEETIKILKKAKSK